MSEVIRFDPVGTIEGFEESEFGQYCFASDLDAQRLRADTAEAERDAAVETISELSDKVVAAEQRIAELRDLLTRCRADSDLWFKEFGEPSDGKYSAAFTEIDALNPNPEAESHE